MIEAWRQRDIERNKLLDELMGMFFRLEEKEEKLIGLGFCEVLIKYLESKQTGVLGLEKRDESTKLFFNGMLPKIKSFGRAPEETDFIIAQLLKKLLNSALTPFYSALTGLEISNPKLIFGADSAMTQQKMPEDS